MRGRSLRGVLLPERGNLLDLFYTQNFSIAILG